MDTGATPDFGQVVQDALDSLPRELRDRISNVEVVVEDEPPAGQPLLGLYQGIPLTRRGSGYNGALPDKITIFRGPLERFTAGTPTCCAGKFGTSFSTSWRITSASATRGLVEIDRY